MAVAVIGGLIVSTVLSLVFVPSFYIITDRVGELAGQFFSRFVTRSSDQVTSASLLAFVDPERTKTPQDYRPAAE